MVRSNATAYTNQLLMNLQVQIVLLIMVSISAAPPDKTEDRMMFHIREVDGFYLTDVEETILFGKLVRSKATAPTS